MIPPEIAATDITSPDQYHDARFIPLRTVFNLRDLGGFTGLDGAEVRTGLVFRSDQFGRIDTDDLTELVERRGLRTVVDLRRDEELAETGTFPDGHGVTTHHVELTHLRWELFDRELHTPDLVGFLVQRYTAMLETGAPAIRRTLELMTTATPLVFCCMAGRDRTGITAAVTLGLLGVRDEDIVADYALSMEGNARYYAWLRDQGDPDPWVGLPPHPDVMRGLLANIGKAFGSIEAYADVIGFTGVTELREHLLS